MADPGEGRQGSCDPSLTDVQWAVIEPLLPMRELRRAGRPSRFSRRPVVGHRVARPGSGRCLWRGG